MEELFEAEKMLKCHDFVGARQLIRKAEQLYPGLDKVSQMVALCNVLSIADEDTDWYRILGVQPTADDAAIQKQYRKFALLLHPDKNKFFGAEAAFKIVGEAMSVLSDERKRLLYDGKRMTGLHVRVQTQTKSGIQVTVQPTSVPHQRGFAKQGVNYKGKGSASGSIPVAGNNNAESRKTVSNMDCLIFVMQMTIVLLLLLIAVITFLICIDKLMTDLANFHEMMLKGS